MAEVRAYFFLLLWLNYIKIPPKLENNGEASLAWLLQLAFSWGATQSSCRIIKNGSH